MSIFFDPAPLGSGSIVTLLTGIWCSCILNLVKSSDLGPSRKLGDWAQIVLLDKEIPASVGIRHPPLPG